MDYEFIKTVIPMYEEAAFFTLKISFVGIVLSFFVGLFCAVSRYEKIPVLKQISSIYIEFSRNTPLLIQIFFLYFAFPRMGVKLSAIQSAVIGLTFLGGSYMAETFRSALEGVSKVQIESAQSLGLKKSQIILYVILPQAVSVSNEKDPINKVEDLNGKTLIIAKGNTSLLNWINEEIKTLGKENFFHADYEATLRDVYGKDSNADELVVEGGQL